ncbi:MAG: caspase family protein [Ferruginibacter sp.]
MLLRAMTPVYIVFLLLCCKLCYAQQPKLMLPIGHTATVHLAVFSPDGKKILTTSSDESAKLWDATTGKLLYDFRDKISKWGSFDAVFSPDGKTIIIDAKVLFDANTGQRIRTLNAFGQSVNGNNYDDGNAIAKFSFDGKKIVTTSYNATLKSYSAKVWNTEDGKLLKVFSGHNSSLLNAQFSPDGEKIVTTSFDSTAKIWEVVTGKLLHDLKGHEGGTKNAMFSPDGKKMITFAYDSIVKIWDVGSGKKLADLTDHISNVSDATFSPDGNKIITASFDGTAKIWDSESGKLLKNFSKNKSGIYTACFSPDGKNVLTASADGGARLWDAFSGKMVLERYNQTYYHDNFASFNPDGKTFATYSDDNSIAIWEATTGNIVTELTGKCFVPVDADFSPDGKTILIAFNDGIARSWDYNIGKMTGVFKGHHSGLRSLHFDPRSFDSSTRIKKVITSSWDSTAKIWDALSGRLLVTIKNKSGYFKTARFSADGKKIVTASNDSSLRIWDANSGKLLAAKKLNHSIMSASFTPDGKRIILGSWYDSSKIWDISSGSFKKSFKWPDTKYSENDVKFSPDGKKVISFSLGAKIWDVASDTLLNNFTYNGRVNDVAFSPDGKKIITVGESKSVDYFNSVTGEILYNTYNDNDYQKHWDVIYSCRFSRDGTKIVTTSRDNTIRLWDADKGKVLYTFFMVNNDDYLIVDNGNHYDGTESARKLLYFTCGTEVIDLDQVKDQLWVPNLAERIMKGETINAKTLDELNICGLTPEVEDASDKAGEYHFKIKPRRGGLGETVLLVNGIEAGRYKTTDLKKNGEFFDLVINKSELKNIFIPGKENPVTVKAYTADNAISSRGLKIVEDKTKELAALPNLYAVMVGVSDYKGTELDLKYAAKDATDMSAAVEAAAKKLLNRDGKEHVFMYNLTTAKERYQLPEKNSIKKLLEEIGKKATANDILMIFFAGHGVMSARAGTDGAGEAETKQFYFLTADASGFTTTGAVKDVGISTTELVEWMKPQNIKAQKRILIFDACNSGQAINDIAGKDLAVRNDDKTQQTKAIDKLNEKSGLFILSASASNQAAYEMGRYSQGLLTYSLLKAIKQQPDILEDGKYLDVSRWFNAGKETVTEISKENGARQEPQIVSNTNFNIGIVDHEVMAKIILPQEKPLFASSNFQNSDEAADGDNLDLSKLINLQLNEIASRDTESEIVYIMATNSPDALTLSGRYDVKGNDVVIRVSIKKNNDTKYRFEEKGTKQNLKELVAAVVKRASEWAAANK